MIKPLFLPGLVFLLGISILAKGQMQQFFPFRKYTQGDGLSSYNITKLFQDKYGFIWVGTQDGLNCFDGKSFLTFKKDGLPDRQLSGNAVMDVVEDRKRELIWVATSYGGVDILDTKTRLLQHPPAKMAEDLKFTGKWVHSLCSCGDILWVGTYSGLFAYNLQTHQFITLSHPSINPADMTVGKLLSDSLGRLWAFCDGQGIFLFDATTCKPLYKIPAADLNVFHSKKPLLFWNIAQSTDHTIIAATNWGIREIHGDLFGIHLLQPAAPRLPYNNEILSCVSDRKRNLWLSDAHSLYKLDDQDQRLYRIAESNNGSDSWETAIYALFVDDQDRVWLGSEEGLSYFAPLPPSFEKYYKSYSSNTKIQHAFSIYPSNDSTVLCGAANGLYSVNTHSHAITKINETSSCYLVARLSDHQTVISNSLGIFLLSDNKQQKITSVYPEFAAIESELLCGWVKYNDSLILMASELHSGLYVWNTRKRKIAVYNSTNSQLHLEDGIINAIFKDREGTAWILSVSSINRFDPLSGNTTTFQLKDPHSKGNCNILFDMCETRDRYWFAAYGMGLIGTDKKMNVIRVIAEKDGLCNNGVYKVFPYKDSLILVTSNNGLSVLDLPDNRLKSYFESDGLQSNAFEQFCGFSGDSTMYAGGVNGFTVIFPKQFSNNRVPPRLYYTRAEMAGRASLFDTTDLNLASLRVPNDVVQTTIFFSGINFSNPERTKYAYRIKELNADWIDLKTQHFINLTPLNPGSYTLETRAANEDNVWVMSPVSMNLVFLPKWYQTAWFKALLIVMVGAVFYGLYRYRLWQLQQQQQIRREIANDLHDDLGSTLNTVKVLTHIAKKEPRKEEYLDQIEHSLTIAAAGLRDLIWVLDDSKDTVNEFMGRILKSVLPITSARCIRVDPFTEDAIKDHLLSKIEKRNLLMIAKETVNNSIKYADCKTIQIQLRSINKKLSLSIQDDGKGFDLAESNEGNGLKNIRYRSKQMNYSASIHSSPQHGTTVEVVKI